MSGLPESERFALFVRERVGVCSLDPGRDLSPSFLSADNLFDLDSGLLATNTSVIFQPTCSHNFTLSFLVLNLKKFQKDENVLDILKNELNESTYF